MPSEKPKVELGQMYRTRGSSDTYRIKFIDLEDRKVQLARLSYSMPKIWLNSLVTALQIEHGVAGEDIAKTVVRQCNERLPDGWDVKEEGSFMISLENFVESGFYQVYSIELPVSPFGISKA